MRFMSLLLASLCVVLTFSGDALAQRPANIVEVVASSGGEFDANPFDYDILLTAVLAADEAAEGELIKALTNPDADLTLFAPNDLGFILTARDLGYTGFSEEGAWLFLVEALTEIGEGDPIPVLTSILTYHVSPKRVTPITLVRRTLKGFGIRTLNGARIYPFFFILQDRDPDLPNPSVTLPFNVRTGNGRVHTINRVLIPVDL